MHPNLDSLDGLLRMRRRHRRNADGLEALVRQHRIVVTVHRGAPRREVLVRPRGFFVAGREDCYERGFGHTVQEVRGVVGAHAAETRDGYAGSADGLGHGGM